MNIANEWKDYEIIDMANGEKIERWGNITLIRPDPQIICVYANKFNTFISLPEFFILFIIQSQFTACSGNSPVCLNPIGFMLKVKFLYFTCQLSGSLF